MAEDVTLTLSRYGIRTSTLDDPGWALDIDLSETPYSGRTISPKLTERTLSGGGA